MQFLMLALLGALVGQGMRRIRMLRHVGQIRAARSLYGRYALLLGGAALCAMGGQLALLGVNGMLHLGTALPLHLCSLMGVLLYPAPAVRLPAAVGNLPVPGRPGWHGRAAVSRHSFLRPAHADGLLLSSASLHGGHWALASPFPGLAAAPQRGGGGLWLSVSSRLRGAERNTWRAPTICSLTCRGGHASAALGGGSHGGICGFPGRHGGGAALPGGIAGCPCPAPLAGELSPPPELAGGTGPRTAHGLTPAV